MPLIVGMAGAAGLGAASMLVTFGAMQNPTGGVYRMPMPAPAPRAVAGLGITQKFAPNIICGAGLAIGEMRLVPAPPGLF